MMNINKCSYCIFPLLLALSAVVFADGIESIENKIDWSARTRYAEYSGEESARAASLLLRLNVDTHWNETISSFVQLDDVTRGFKSQHSDGVDLNGKPVIPDAEGFDVNQAYLGLNFDSVKFQLGRQRINLDDQRFIGGNGFWQNEQTFDAALAKIKFLNNSQVTYAYIDNVNRIFGNKADKDITTITGGNGDYPPTATTTERPAGILGEHKHHTNIAQFDFKEWDYSEVIAYAYAIDNLTLPSASNNTLGANYTFNYKADVLKYRVKVEYALQKQPELNDSPLLPYYLLDAGIGINHIEFAGRYEILSHKDGVNFIAPLGSSHDFQGLANQMSNYAANGIKDASFNITWRDAPFKIESQYHRFNSYTSNNFIAQELDLSFSYKPTRKHAVTLLFAYFKPDAYTIQKDDTRHVYLDYAYNF